MTMGDRLAKQIGLERQAMDDDERASAAVVMAALRARVVELEADRQRLRELLEEAMQRYLHHHQPLAVKTWKGKRVCFADCLCCRIDAALAGQPKPAPAEAPVHPDTALDEAAIRAAERKRCKRAVKGYTKTVEHERVLVVDDDRYGGRILKAEDAIDAIEEPNND
jgi:hypothetical protein